MSGDQRQQPQGQNPYEWHPDTNLMFTIGRLSSSVDDLRNDIREDRKKREDMDTRVAALEKRGWVQQGYISVGSLVVNTIITFLIYRYAAR